MADKDKLVTLEDLKVAYDDTEGKVSDLKSALSYNTLAMSVNQTFPQTISSEITCSRIAPYEFSISGTATADRNIKIAEYALPDGFYPGQTVYVQFERPNNTGVVYEIYEKTTSNTSWHRLGARRSTSEYVTLPADITHILLRLVCTSGSTFSSSVVTFACLNQKPVLEIIGNTDTGTDSDTITGAIAEHSDDIDYLSDQFSLNVYGMPVTEEFPATTGIVTWTQIGNYTFSISSSGTLSEDKYKNTTSISLPENFSPGQKVFILFDKGDNDGIVFDIYVKTESDTSWHGLVRGQSKSRYVDLPDDITDIILRLVCKEGNSFSSAVVTFACLNTIPYDVDKTNLIVSELDTLSTLNLNNVTGNHVWLMGGSNTYTNKPSGYTLNTGILVVMRAGNYILQLLYQFTGGKVYKRRGNASGTTWEDWLEIGGSGGDTYNYTNEFTLNTYENTYNVTATPSITTDTNQYLAPTGDNTDVKLAVETLLNTSGVCRFGPGEYYVSGIDMPDGSALIGSGPATKIILLGTHETEGYAIHMGHNCLVKNMAILGSSTNRSYSSVSSTIINRHGILFEAQASEQDANTKFRLRGTVESCWIRNFTGGGITCYNTGYNTAASLGVTDTYIYYCNAGIYIPFFSEFHRFTGVQCQNNYYGVVNNGGNNVFVNCGFSANRVGMLMDNSTGAARNNSHGTVVGCVFDHSDENNGVGIMLDGMENGEIFSDCQLFYSDIVVNNSKGIQFNNFNIGGGNCGITVTKGNAGGLIIFNDCVFAPGTYEIDVDSGYTECKFVNCWTTAGNAVTA